MGGKFIYVDTIAGHKLRLRLSSINAILAMKNERYFMGVVYSMTDITVESHSANLIEVAKEAYDYINEQIDDADE
jgi:hypothetical protein